MCFSNDDTEAEREQGWLTVWQSSTPGVAPNSVSMVAKLPLRCVVLVDELWSATPSALQLELAGGLMCFSLVCDCP